MTEPVLRNSSEAVSLPKEPTLHKEEEGTLPTSGETTEVLNEHQPIAPARNRLGDANREILKSLARDIEELSKPYVPPKETPAEDTLKAETDTADNTDTNDEPEENETSGSSMCLRFVVTLIFALAAVWQVCLFLQPAFMRNDNVRDYAEMSCNYFYCPPLRELRILDSELQAVSPDKWEMHLTLQNQDMRDQPLPQILLRLNNPGTSLTKMVFDAKHYSVEPKVIEIEGGQTVRIDIPFRHDEGRPATFEVKVIPPGISSSAF